MPLSQTLRKLTEVGLLIALTPRPPSQPIPPQFRMDLHCAYHQGPGHETDRYTALKHAVDPHFSRASPLDRRDSLFICEKLIFFFKKSWSRHLFYFFLKGKIKQEIKP